MMKIDTKNPYAMKPKKVDNELGIYNADYENFMHYAEQTIGECDHIDEYRKAIEGFLEIYNSVCYMTMDVKINEYNSSITADKLFSHVMWLWNEYWSAQV